MTSRLDCLATQAELGNQRLITFFIDTVQIIEKTTTLGNKFQKTTAGMVILLVGFEMLGQIGNTFRQNSKACLRSAVIDIGSSFQKKWDIVDAPAGMSSS